MVVPSMQKQEAYELEQRKFPFIILYPSEQARCYRETAVEDTLILPHSEAIVAAKIMDNALCEPWGTIGPFMTAMLPPDVMVCIDTDRCPK